MRWLIPAFVFALSLVGAGSALVDWRDQRALVSLSVKLAEVVSAEQEIGLVRDFAGASLGSGRLFARLSARLRREGEVERDPKRRLELFCESLGALGAAIHREPWNAGYLINWANLRQLLGSVGCAQEFTEGDFRAAASAALAADPTNTRVLYAAAQLAAWSGDEAEVDRMLNKFLSLKVDIRPNETEFVFSNLTDGNRVERIVPARFPHVIQWARIMRERKPELFRQFGGNWGTIQSKAIEESKAALAAKGISGEIHRHRLSELGEFAANSEVRRRADFELGESYRRSGKENLAEYYTNRAELEQLQVVRAIQKRDTRPAATSLVSWSYDEIAAFDDFYTSVGFFAPVGFQPRLIEISAAAPDARLDGNSIQVLASPDNATWVELGDRVKLSALVLGSSPSIALRLEGGSFRYWKVHFGSSERSRSFRNSLGKLIKVYGVRWSE